MIRKLSLLLLLTAAALPGGAQCCPPKPQTAKRQVLWQKLQQEIRAVDQQLDGVLAVAVKDLTSEEEFFINPDEVMPQASSIKITVLAELYRQAQQGKLKLTDEYVVRKEDMVSGSDIMLESQGLHVTRLRRKMMDLKAASEGRENVSTPREMMTLLETIYRGKLLNKEMTEDFLKMLSTHKESALLQGLPDDAVAANKPGELEAVRNDSGIVLAKNRPYILCVMTAYLKDEREGSATIRKIAALTYSYFDRVGRASEYGRVVSPK